jgi:tetratricopeptide (TPR) repeat protein
MSSRKFSMGFCLVLFLALAQVAQAAKARVWEGTITIPTYLMGPDDPNPQFPLVNDHNIYPYTQLDDLTNNRQPKAWKAIYLENKYLKVTILPQMDGRVYSIYDKIAKHEVLYRNNVVKYEMVGLRGAWISGGIEWNFPNGHNTDTVSPVASRIHENPDGSATAVVGDLDQVSHMHWEVALTLHPDAAYLQAHVTLFNSTPVARLHWWWANSAVRATDDLQFFIPMRWGTTMREVQTYPIWQGTDHSWYKNWHHASDLFAIGVHRSFFGAYYHKLNYGVVQVSNYREVPGKKFFTWGNSGDGDVWVPLLTDNDGQYCEIQAGHFRTQGLRNFIPPQRVESWNEYWYPVAKLDGGFVEGTRQMAINIVYPSASEAGKSAVLAVSPVAVLNGLKIEVKMGSQTLKDFSPVSFEPLDTKTFAIPVADVATAKKELDVTITDAEGKTLLHWNAAEPVDGNPDLSVKTGLEKVDRRPDSELSVEDLFLRGLDVEKKGRSLEAIEIYKEVLKRDSEFIPALLKLAQADYEAADFAGAEALVARARAREEENPQVNYMAGVIYKAAGKLGLAKDGFWYSLRFGGAKSPALVQLGEIAIHQKDYAGAAKLLRRAVQYNPDDGVALSDLAVALRLGGHSDEALKAADQAVEKMPILPFALAEKWKEELPLGTAEYVQHSEEVFRNTVGYRSQGYMEAAAWYRRLGDLSSSNFFLAVAAKFLAVKNVSPLIWYYRAANSWDEGDEQGGSTLAGYAEKANVEAVFPNRPEDARVLREVLAHNPADSHAKYFLGTFLFAHSRYAEAADLWKQAVAEGFHYAVLYRNLGVYAWKVQNDPATAATYYAEAIKQAPQDFRLYVDLDELYTQLDKTGEREKLFASAPPEVLEKNAVRNRRVLLDVQTRNYDDALNVLRGYNFKAAEGGRISHELFVLANIQKGRAAFEAGQFGEAEGAFRAALEYPKNLPVGKPEHPQDQEALYWLGRALDEQGKKSEARDVWQKCVNETRVAEGEVEGGVGGPSRFYAALAMERVGHTEEASRILDRLAGEPEDGHKSADAYYLAGLVANYRKQEEQASSDFRRALELDPGLWQARVELQRKDTPE